MATKRRNKKSKYDALISLLIWCVSGSVLLIVLAVIAYNRGSWPGLLLYTATVALAFLIAFLSLVFWPWGSRWMQLGFWGLPVSLLIVVSLKGYGGGWVIAYGLGLLTAAQLVRSRHRRNTQKQFGGRVLLTAPKKRKTLTAALTITGFREALSQLDDSLQPVMKLSINGKRLDVFGPAAGPLVVYGTLDESDDLAWRRLSTPDIGDPDVEVTVPVGKLDGVYRKQSTVDMKLVKQAGEYFIRTGQLDPSLTWESGDDVHNRLPPTRLRT